MHITRDLLTQIAIGDSTNHALHLAGGTREILNQTVDRLSGRKPDLIRSPQRQPLRELALLTHNPTDLDQLGPQRLIRGDDVVQPVSDLTRHARPPKRHTHTEVAMLNIRQHTQQHRPIELLDHCGHLSHLRRLCNELATVVNFYLCGPIKPSAISNTTHKTSQ